MKINKFIYGSILFMSVIGTSCTEFLSEHNYNDLTTDNGYYDTASGLESLINSCYTSMRFWGGKSAGTAFSDLGTDLITGGAGCDYPTLAYYQSDLKSDTPVIEELYDRLYRAINFCNTAIKHCVTADSDADVRLKRESEARFLRAYYYWLLVETWGDIYYTENPSESIVVAPEKTSVEKVYEKIFADLDFCINNNALSSEHSDGGRITIWAAKAFKARLSLNRGTVLNDNNLYSQAYDLAKDIVDNGPFKLSDNYKDIFSMENSDGSSNDEVIWYVDYSSINQLYNQELDDDIVRSGGHHLHLCYCMKYDDQPGLIRSIEYGRPFNHYMPTRYLLDLYSENDQRLEGSFQTLWEMNGGDPGANYPLMKDTAIWATRDIVSPEKKKWAEGRYQIVDRNVMYNEDGSAKNQKQYMALSKFADPTRLTANEDRGTRDAFLFRISEMYLIIAEAGAKSGKSDALDYMNDLRVKRAVSGKENEMKVTQADIENLDFILDERGRELAGEQLRWFDLKRFGEEVFLRRVKEGNPDAGKNVKSHHMLRPFPQSFLDAITNKEVFTQNTGY